MFSIEQCTHKENTETKQFFVYQGKTL